MLFQRSRQGECNTSETSSRERVIALMRLKLLDKSRSRSLVVGKPDALNRQKAVLTGFEPGRKAFQSDSSLAHYDFKLRMWISRQRLTCASALCVQSQLSKRLPKSNHQTSLVLEIEILIKVYGGKYVVRGIVHLHGAQVVPLYALYVCHDVIQT